MVDDDYEAVIGDIIQFNTGDVTQTHTITINQDEECEKNPNENFFSNIVLNDRSIPDITVTEPQATVTIDDAAEPQCGIYELFCRRRQLLRILFHIPSEHQCWL